MQNHTQKGLFSITSLDQCEAEYRTGTKVLEERGTLIVGMSVGSGRFNRYRVETLTRELSPLSNDVQLMITDAPARHTRSALGEAPDAVQKYCKKKGDQLRSYASEALSHAGSPCEVFSWPLFYASTHYQREYAKLQTLFLKKEVFYHECCEQTARVLSRELGGTQPATTQIEIGARYILEELAALSVAPVVLNVPRVAYLYYDSWTPFQKLVRGEYDNRPRNDVGFVTYTIVEEYGINAHPRAA